MPIKIQSDLPAKAELEHENIFVMDENRAISQNIRPLEIVILNLMPIKQDTELQLLRGLSNTPLQVNITLLRVDDHISKNTPQSHMDNFYKEFEDIKDQRFDGMIVTGAALDQTEFKDVTYWEKLEKILLWSSKNVTSTLFSCWGVAAALRVFYGIDIIFREDKL